MQEPCARSWTGSAVAPTNARLWLCASPAATASPKRLATWRDSSFFGSFVTSTSEPNDVDVFLIMANAFDASQLRAEAQLLFDHGAAQAHFGASVFWLRRLAAWPDEQTAVEFWQVKRGGGHRGIVEVTRGEAS